MENLLSLIQKPSRYIGQEYNADILKEKDKVKLKFCLVFPDLYEIGMSHVGIKILYHLLASQKDILVDTAFMPDKDYAGLLRQKNKDLKSIHYNIPLKEFDIIGFSLSYELSFTNVLEILSLSNIPIHSEKRISNYPLIIAGGSCTCNPEPMVDFIDAFVLGDAEETILDIAECVKNNKGVNKDNLLLKVSKINGLYAPQLWDKKKIIKSRIIKDLDKVFFLEDMMVPFVNIVHNHLSVEIQRGCFRGCKFCQAGYINRPVRYRSKEKIFNLIKKGLKSTGYSNVSLLSLSVVDHPEIQSIVTMFLNEYYDKKISISLPSLRCDNFSVELAGMVNKNKKSSLTFAPEAGSQRLRDYIGKNVKEEDIFNSVESAYKNGWKLVKLYFMYGLPSEEDKDIEAIPILIRKLKKEFKGLRFNVGISSFVPKPHTPFQWEAQNSMELLFEKKVYLLNNLKRLANVKHSIIEASIVEGLISRGEKKIGRVIEDAWKKGAVLAQWKEHFNFNLWKEACINNKIDIDNYISRRRDFSEKLPWSHLDFGINQDMLKKILETKTKRTEIRYNNKVKEIKLDMPCAENTESFRFRVLYEKLEEICFVSHLEIVDSIRRSLRRTSLPLVHVHKFHPMPKVSFNFPLQVGFAGKNEWFDFEISIDEKEERILKLLNNHFPKGFKIKRVKKISGDTKSLDRSVKYIRFNVKCPKGIVWDKSVLKKLYQKESWIVDNLFKKSKQDIDLKQVIDFINIKEDFLDIILNVASININILKLLASFFNLDDNDLKEYNVIRTDLFVKKEGKLYYDPVLNLISIENKVETN